MNKVMTHLIAGYPDMEISMDAARGLIDGGCSYLEVQFPFSDPSADGPLIQEACSDALEAGFTVEKGFEFIRNIRKYSEVPIFIMSYGNLLYFRGIEQFCIRAGEAGVQGLIIPDLAPGHDEGLFETAAAHGLVVVPVIVPTITPERLKLITDMKLEYIYTALRVGITGRKTVLDDELLSFLDRVKESGAKILAGFGIREKDQVDALSSHVHASIMGSELVRIIKDSSGKDGNIVYNEVKMKVQSLL